MLDNVSCHSWKLEKVQIYHGEKKKEKREHQKEIPFAAILKVQLLITVNDNKQKYNLYVIDELAKSNDKAVL